MIFIVYNTNNLVGSPLRRDPNTRNDKHIYGVIVTYNRALRGGIKGISEQRDLILGHSPYT